MDCNTTNQLIAKYRFALFGLSLVWIFFRHTYFYNQFTYGIFDYLVQIGDCGVDIFMFLSGFGLYHSFEKNNKINEFYKKRIVRIIPTTVILLAVFAIIQDIMNGDNSYTIFRPHYWIMSIYSMYWFIGAILLFYICYPIIHKYLLPLNSIGIIIASISICIFFILAIKFVHIGLIAQLEVYFARIPIFIIGAIFAKNKKYLGYGKIIFILFILSIPLLYILPKSLQRMSYAPLSIAFVIYVPYILRKSPAWFTKVLSIIGTASLEFYLIHIFLFYNGILGFFNRQYSQTVTIVIVFIIVFASSWLFNRFFIKLNNLLNK